MNGDKGARSTSSPGKGPDRSTCAGCVFPRRSVSEDPAIFPVPPCFPSKLGRTANDGKPISCSNWSTLCTDVSVASTSMARMNPSTDPSTSEIANNVSRPYPVGVIGKVGRSTSSISPDSSPDTTPASRNRCVNPSYNVRLDWYSWRRISYCTMSLRFAEAVVCAALSAACVMR